MVKRIQKAVKEQPTRKRKKIIVVGTEGKNKTEVLYLRELERKQNQYHFIFDQGKETDPVRIVESTIKRVKKEQLSFENGDLAVSIFDMDLNPAKRTQLVQAKSLSSKENVDLITSNPCFEIWFLEHFHYTAKPFNNNQELIKELQKFIPNYSKNQSFFEILFPRIQDAISNCKSLDEHHKQHFNETIWELCNPRTDFYMFIEDFFKEK